MSLLYNNKGYITLSIFLSDDNVNNDNKLKFLKIARSI